MQQKVNGSLYSRFDIVAEYKNAYLNPQEAATLVRYRDDIADKSVLDLGCGAGRLAVYLGPHTNQYVGFDISPAHDRGMPGNRFPELEFCRRGDMRDLGAFADASFSAVFAVFNLFDAVGHAERLKVLAEVRRVLVPDGLLAFSAHNRNYIEATAEPRLHVSRNPFTQVRWFLDYVHARRNCSRIRPHQRFESDYALLNDSGHNYAVLHYYISRSAQAKQLRDTGFRLLECLDEAGRTLTDDADDTSSASLHYIARKSG